MKPLEFTANNRLWQALVVAVAILTAEIAWSATDPTLTVNFNLVTIGLTPTSQNIILSWASANTVPYQVQTSTSMSGWTNIGPAMTGNGSVLSSTNSVVGQSRGFFRVQRVFPAPAGSAVFNPATGLLTIVGDLAHTIINVANDGSGNIVVNGGTIPIIGGVPTIANTVLIQILGSTGGDQISLGNGLPIAQIFGAEGNDTIVGGDGSDVIVGGPGNDTVRGGRGNDLIYLDRGDTATWNPGDGSDTVEGWGGNNTLLFNGANVNENIALSANGARLRITRDVANITMDLNGVENININTLGGADNVTVNSLAGTGVTQVNLDLAASGGGGDGQADTVTINGTAGADTFNVAANSSGLDVTALGTLVHITNAEPANDRVVLIGAGSDLVNVNGTAGADTLQVIASATHALAFASTSSIPLDLSGALSLSINGLAGPDTITAGSGLAATGIPLTLDGGDGDDIITGSDAADTIIGGLDNDTVSSGRGNDTIFLGDGNDTAIWNPGDGNDIIEGQAGNDTLVFNGANVTENIALSANGSRLRLTRDIANIVMDVNGVETINVQALGGADNLTLNSLAGTSVTQVNLDLAASGGGGDGAIDTVTFNGTTNADTFSTSANGTSVEVSTPWSLVRVSHGELANDRILINGLGGDTVNINGTSGADTMQVLASPVSGLRTTVAAYSLQVDVTGALSLAVNGLGSGDTITGTTGVGGFAIPITLDGGDGDDSITGTDAGDLILGGAGNDTVTPSRGSDMVLLGADNDTVIWNPGDGNDKIEGQGGSNTLTFNGANIAENIDLSTTNGTRLRLFRDVANIMMDVNGVQTVNIVALGGADNIVVNSLAGTSVSLVNVDANASGGIGDGLIDTVTINGTGVADSFVVSASGGTVVTSGITPQVQIAHPEAAFDKLVINGLGGTDTFNIGAVVFSLIGVTANQ